MRPLLLALSSALLAGAAQAQLQPASPAHAAVAPLVAGTVIVGPSDSRITGSGRAVEEVRTVPTFSAVRVTGPIDVELRAAAREQVTVRFDDDLQVMIETRVESADTPTLEIRVMPGAAFKSRHTPKVVIEFKAISALSMQGSGDALVDGVSGPLFALAVAGSSDVRARNLNLDVLGVSIAGSGDFVASGRAAEQGYSIAGSGDVRALELAGRTVKVRIAGSGDAQVHAEDLLDVSIAGSGDVIYRGTPVIRKRVAGSGEVRPAR